MATDVLSISTSFASTGVPVAESASQFETTTPPCHEAVTKTWALVQMADDSGDIMVIGAPAEPLDTNTPADTDAKRALALAIARDLAEPCCVSDKVSTEAPTPTPTPTSSAAASPATTPNGGAQAEPAAPDAGAQTLTFHGVTAPGPAVAAVAVASQEQDVDMDIDTDTADEDAKKEKVKSKATAKSKSKPRVWRVGARARARAEASTSKLYGSDPDTEVEDDGKTTGCTEIDRSAGKALIHKSKDKSAVKRILETASQRGGCRHIIVNKDGAVRIPIKPATFAGRGQGRPRSFEFFHRGPFSGTTFMINGRYMYKSIGVAMVSYHSQSLGLYVHSYWLISGTASPDSNTIIYSQISNSDDRAK